jgi:glycosyltransferase involved in cell wall biosynthesis
MSCGTICAVTDVGDSAKIVGDLGFVAPPKDPEKLAIAIKNAIEFGEKTPYIKEKLRALVADRFSVGAMLERTILAIEKLF